MRVRTGGGTCRGRAIDLSEEQIAPADIVAAVRSSADSSVISIDCPNHGPVHEYVAHIESEMSIRVRPAVAAAARSLGVDAPQDGEIADIEEALCSLDVEDISLRAERRRVADVSGSETQLRERVAALRGRVQALRESGKNPAEAESKLLTATRKLSETETKRIAAEQTLDVAQERQRSARDLRERRLRLRDRKSNLERTARGELVRQVHERFVAAVDAVPGRGRVTKSGVFEGDRTTAALAVVRMARIRAPVVLTCDRFQTPESAADCLDAPVLQV